MLLKSIRPVHILCAICLALAVASTIVLEQRRLPEIRFEAIADLEVMARRHSLYVYRLGWMLFIADHPVESEQLRTMRMGDLDKPEWQGVVLSTACVSTAECPPAMVPHCVDAPHRIWGKLLVAGDEKLIDYLGERARDTMTYQ